jgi:hypothetical protein
LRCDATPPSHRQAIKENELNLFRSFTAALIALASLASPALADRLLDGAEAHAMLSGRQFEFICADGTRGRARYGKSGVATANYLLPTAPDNAKQLTDRGHVRITGENICIRWQDLNGGKEGCYRVTERRPGVYRISEGAARWCELTTGDTLQAGAIN